MLLRVPKLHIRKRCEISSWSFRSCVFGTVTIHRLKIELYIGIKKHPTADLGHT